MKTFLLSISFLVYTMSSSQDLSLDIIPHTSIKDTFLISNPTYQEFHVLITNNSDKPINIFDPKWSYGFYNLTFEIEYSNGEKKECYRHSWGWDKNFPGTQTIAPNSHYIFNIDLEADTTKAYYWINSPLSKDERFSICNIKAIYTQHKSKDAKNENVWIGRIESEKALIKIWH